MKDWPEDFKYENGNYYCRCLNCDGSFMGHKRRVMCKHCVNVMETYFFNPAATISELWHQGLDFEAVDDYSRFTVRLSPDVSGLHRTSEVYCQAT